VLLSTIITYVQLFVCLFYGTHFGPEGTKTQSKMLEPGL